MGRARKDDGPAEPLGEAVISTVADEVRREGAVARASLAKLGVPKARVAEAVDALVSIGLEATSKLVRVPVPDQIEARLREATVLPYRSLHDVAAGASKKEAAAAADGLVASGRAARVVRSKELVLVAPDAAILDASAIAALERGIDTLGRALKLAKSKKATLLASDVAKELGAFAASPPSPVSRDANRAPTPDDVATLVARHRESSGLTFVPKIVRALGGTTARDVVHAALLQGAKSGLYELRPESGMGRLSDDDLGLCIPGPQGSHLSWVRRIEESA